MKDWLSKFGVLGALYLAQGIPHGFFQVAAPAIFRERGMPLDQIGLFAVFYLPWALKFVWAPFTDRVYSHRIGRRRSWIIPLQIITAAAFFSLSFWDADVSIGYLIAIILVCNFAAATQDAATDGFAVEALSPKERGWGNGIQAGGYWIGFIAGGGMTMILEEQLGWSMVFTLLSLLLLLALIPILLRKDPPKPNPEHSTGEGLIKELWRGMIVFLKQPMLPKLLLVLVLARMGGGFAKMMLSPMMVDMAFEKSMIGWVIGLGSPLGGVLGAVIGALMANPLGRKKALLAAMVVQGLALGALGLISAMSEPHTVALIVAIMLDNAATSMVIVGVFALMMDWAHPEQGAAEYSLMDCIGVFGTIVASVSAGALANALGYALNFGLSAGLVIVSMLLVLWLFPEREAAEHG